MTNAYGVPGEVGGWPPSEAQEVECLDCGQTFGDEEVSELNDDDIPF